MIRSLFSFLVLIAFFNPFTQAWIASQFVADDGIAPSDVVLALRGDGPEQLQRTDEALRILANHDAPILLLDVSRQPFFGRTEHEIEEDYLKQRGVPQRQLRYCENNADSTAEEAIALRECLENLGAKSVIAVTSEYHTRRARFILRQAFAGSGIAVRIHPVYNPEYWDPHWWRKRRWAKTFFEESEKTAWTLLEDLAGRLHFHETPPETPKKEREVHLQQGM